MAWGDTFFIHPADKNRLPFATIVTKGYGDFDAGSNLGERLESKRRDLQIARTVAS